MPSDSANWIKPEVIGDSQQRNHYNAGLFLLFEIDLDGYQT